VPAVQKRRGGEKPKMQFCRSHEKALVDREGGTRKTKPGEKRSQLTSTYHQARVRDLGIKKERTTMKRLAVIRKKNRRKKSCQGERQKSHRTRMGTARGRGKLAGAGGRRKKGLRGQCQSGRGRGGASTSYKSQRGTYSDNATSIEAKQGNKATRSSQIPG